MKTKLFACLALLGLAQCRKDDPDPASRLPPANQSGANSFGCLVDGQPWTPQGNDGSANYSVSYDPTYHQGTLSVAAYRYERDGNERQTIVVFSDSLAPKYGLHKIRMGGHHGAGFANGLNNCRYSSTDSTTYCRGELVITRLDEATGILTGTFWFTLAKPGCDTVRITQGRFNKRL